LMNKTYSNWREIFTVLKERWDGPLDQSRSVEQ
jgi:hypothetical protein